jgi:hypothetical protein
VRGLPGLTVRTVSRSDFQSSFRLVRCG